MLQAKSESVFVMVMRDQYAKMTQAIPTSKATATLAANGPFDHCTVPNGIRNHFLTYNIPQFRSKGFKTLFAFLGLKRVTKTEFHL